METTTRLCRFCQKALDLRVGRKDRIYCNELCKNSFHNSNGYEEKIFLRRVNRILKNNRKILRKLFLRPDHASIDRDTILREGFDFNYYTHHITTRQKQHQYTFCFDYGYRLNEANRYTIIQSFEQVEAIAQARLMNSTTGR